MEIECLPFMYKVLSSIFSSTHTNTIDTYLCTHFLGINVTFQGLKLLDHKGSTCLAVKLSLLLSGKHWAFFFNKVIIPIFLLMVLIKQDLSILGWPWICHPSASASSVLRLQAWITPLRFVAFLKCFITFMIQWVSLRSIDAN